MKRIPTAVIGALALGFTGAGFAAGSYDSSSGMSSGGAGGASASTQAPDLSSSFKSTDLIGMNVSNSQNDNLGSISNLIVDKDGKVSYVVLNETGGTSAGGAHKYMIPWSRVSLTPGQNVAMVDVDRTALSSEFAAFDESMTAPVSGSSPSGTSNAPGSSGGSMSTPPAGGSSGGGY
jgi:sporulation protein YlmC with PRC-barrel domain